eukprot:gene15399-21013_t
MLSCPGAVDTELSRHLEELLLPYTGAWVSAWSKAAAQAAIWDPETASLSQLFAAVAPPVVG